MRAIAIALGIGALVGCGASRRTVDVGRTDVAAGAEPADVGGRDTTARAGSPRADEDWRSQPALGWEAARLRPISGADLGDVRFLLGGDGEQALELGPAHAALVDLASARREEIAGLTGAQLPSVAVDRPLRWLAAHHAGDHARPSLEVWDLRARTRLRRTPIDSSLESGPVVGSATAALLFGDHVELHDLPTGSVERIPLRLPEGLYAGRIAISDDDRLVAITLQGGARGEIRVLDRSGRTLATLASPLAGRDDHVTVLRFGARGALLAIGTFRTAVQLVEIRSGRAVIEIARLGDTEIGGLAIRDDGRALLASPWQGDALALIDESGAITPLWAPHAQATDAVWAPDGDVIAGRYMDVHRWDAPSWALDLRYERRVVDCGAQLVLGPAPIVHVVCADSVASWDLERGVNVATAQIDARDSALARRPEIPERVREAVAALGPDVRPIDASADGVRALVQERGERSLFELATGARVAVPTQFCLDEERLFAADGAWFASCDGGREITLRGAADGAVLRTLRPGDDPIPTYRIRVLESGTVLVESDNGIVRAIDSRDGRVRGTWRAARDGEIAETQGWAVAPGEGEIAVPFTRLGRRDSEGDRPRSGGIARLRLPDLAPIAEHALPDASAMTYTPDGERLIALGAGRLTSCRRPARSRRDRAEARDSRASAAAPPTLDLCVSLYVFGLDRREHERQHAGAPTRRPASIRGSPPIPSRPPSPHAFD